jgi:hypothetical protein
LTSDVVAKPSRRQVLILGGVGLTAATAGAIAWEVSADGSTPPADGYADDKHMQIKGYASTTSVGHGETVDFHVSVNPAQKFHVQIARLGRASAQPVLVSPEVTGATQQAPQKSGATRTVVAPWSASWQLTVPQDWASGLYLATFVNESGYRNHTPFVVRDDSAKTDLLVVVPFTTYQAYNLFPADKRLGSSLYNAWSDGKYGGTDVCSTRVSFDRPYAADGLPDYFELDRAFAEWVDAQHYTVSYATSLDLHAGRVDPSRHKALVFSGHDEYWSPQMRAALDGALAEGVSAAFLAANNIYWNIRVDPSAGGVEHRQVTCYKRHPDPQAGVDGALATVLWRDVGRPEQLTLGAMYRAIVTDAAPRPLVVDSADHWFWRGTGVRNGDAIPKIVGGEADQFNAGLKGRPDVDVLARSPFTAAGAGGAPVTETQHTVVHRQASGAWVFDAGTFYWNRGLNTPGYVDPRIQTATRNVLDRMTGKTSAASA